MHSRERDADEDVKGRTAVVASTLLAHYALPRLRFDWLSVGLNADVFVVGN